MRLSRRHLITAAAAGAVGAPLVAVAAAPARALLPADCSPRYLGYRAADRGTPWAKYFTGRTVPPQPEVTAAHAGPATPAARIPAFDDLAAELAGPGYSPVETGYGKRSDGTVWAAARTAMPGVTAAMWDWWFGWHLTHASRYKLWHPDAHAFAAVSPVPAGTPARPDGRSYIGRVSYVDEYIGTWMEQLTIRFLDPATRGIAVPAGSTVILARVGSAVLPIDLGWVVHQVRPVPGGSEMRSRFYLNLPGVHDTDLRQTACAIARGPLEPILTPLPFNEAFARELMLHCGQEMNHLSRFLPALHAEFRGTA